MDPSCHKSCHTPISSSISNGRMFQAYIPVIRVIADRGLTIHFHFDVITVGKDHKRGHQPVALIITLENSVVGSITISCSGFFWLRST